MKKTTRLQELFQQEKIFVIPGGGCPACQDGRGVWF